MIETSGPGLHLKGVYDVLPTIEVDVADDPNTPAACEAAMAETLAYLGGLKRPPTVTVYVYEGPSINFGDLTHSVFYAIGGPEKVLVRLRAGLHAVRTPAPRIRFSESIHAARCRPRLHLEGGTLWFADDGGGWWRITSRDADVHLPE